VLVFGNIAIHSDWIANNNIYLVERQKTAQSAVDEKHQPGRNKARA